MSRRIVALCCVICAFVGFQLVVNAASTPTIVNLPLLVTARPTFVIPTPLPSPTASTSVERCGNRAVADGASAWMYDPKPYVTSLATVCARLMRDGAPVANVSVLVTINSSQSEQWESTTNSDGLAAITFRVQHVSGGQQRTVAVRFASGEEVLVDWFPADRATPTPTR